eukprot:6809078-Prymnesium_polylepis.1
MIEAQRRFCEGAETTEVVLTPTPPVRASDRSLVATLLDLRTCSGNHLSKEQFAKAKELFVVAYVEFAQKAKAFTKAKHAAWEKKAAEQAAAAAAEAATLGTSSSAHPTDVKLSATAYGCLLYTSDAADDM